MREEKRGEGGVNYYCFMSHPRYFIHQPPLTTIIITGEFRFRRGYNKSNPRKMVKVWAEKEMRNLLRMKQAGLRCPTPYFLKQHVLGMAFVGREGWPAPRLKDAVLTVCEKRKGREGREGEGEGCLFIYLFIYLYIF